MMSREKPCFSYMHEYFPFWEGSRDPKAVLFFFKPAPSFPPSFFCYFLSPLLLFMAVILLEFKQLVVWSKVCGFSGLIVMAASESEESHRAVGKHLLFSPSLLWFPTLATCSCQLAGESLPASSLRSQAPLFYGLSFAVLVA